jgi:hypothetical protein
MFNTLKNALRSLRIPTDAERELAYLNEAVSRIDLEARERQVEAGLFRTRRMPF